MNRRSAFLVALLSLGAWPKLVSAGEPPSGFLLRWQIAGGGDAGEASETLVFLDGLASTKSVREGKATYYRVQAKPGALAELRTKLTANRVGFQPNVTCESDSLFPDSGPYLITVTWFGRAGRQSRFAFSNEGALPRCEAEPESIALAIRDFLGNGVTIVEVVQTDL